VAGSDREGRFDGLPPAGELPPVADGSVRASPLAQTLAAHLGWGPVPPIPDSPPGQPAYPPYPPAWTGSNPLAPEPDAGPETIPPWAEWAASIAGPPPEDVSPEAFTFAGDDELEELPAGSGFFGFVLSSLSSMLIHLVGLISLGLWITAGADQGQPPLRPLVAYQMLEEEKEDEIELELKTVLLDESLSPGTELTSVAISIPVPGSASWAPDGVILPEPQWSRTSLDWLTDHVSGTRDLLAPAPQGAFGTARAVVDDYGQALDHITREILKMLAERKVLLVWCFDQSESMKDDQQEIRARLERVYTELGMTGATSSDALMTAVTSFGQGFLAHTERPTTDVEVVREAIDAVPIDPSGEEFMCSAVFQSIGMYQEFAKRQNRQMALVVVSDESGNREEADTYLEAAVGRALAAQCKVYVLGREAVFGYPYARIRWVHPQTGQVHELPMDRGPETAFVELLQTEGLEPRSDALPSGFGPYAQSRLAWRTGGIFFMLPSLESDLIGAEKRRYDSEVMRPYWPDLRSREEILVDAQRRPLRTLIWKIVDDLDPHRPEVAKMMTFRESFSADLTEFRRQMHEAQGQADFYFAGLERGIGALDAQESSLEREPSPRWRANYDLVRAQLVAYAARVHGYRVALNKAAKKLIVTPPVVAPDKRLVGWKIRRHKKAPIDPAAAKMLERSKDLYLAVIENHPGTPWAARAEWELKRDFNYPGSALARPRAVPADPDAPSAGDASDDGQTASAIGAGVRVASRRRVGRGGGVGTGVGVGVGVGGGGGGGGGGGVGVGVGAEAGVESGTSGWGLDWYAGIELVPEYRAPRPPRPPGVGAGPRPGRQPTGPPVPPIPVARL